MVSCYENSITDFIYPLADLLHNIGSYVEDEEPLIDIYIGESKTTLDDSFGFILEWLQSKAESE